MSVTQISPTQESDAPAPQPRSNVVLEHLRPAIVLTLLLTIVTGLIYPGIVTGLAQLIFPYQANGSLHSVNGKVIGSDLIGEYWTSAKYFHGRPSATSNPSTGAPSPYEADNSSASNLGPTSSSLINGNGSNVTIAKGTPVPANATPVAGQKNTYYVPGTYLGVKNYADQFPIFEDYLRKLLNKFWFVPGLISLLGPLFAFLFLDLDAHLRLNQEPFVFHGGAPKADTILSTIAGSLITVEGLAFSITIVVLQLVSSQYTPRALRGFLQDRVTQAVAGGFFAIFAYSLLVLAAIREPTPIVRAFSPTLSVTVALGLGFLGLALLLIFVHHTGRVIQVSDIAARLAAQTLQAIDHPYPVLMSVVPVDEATSHLIQSWHIEEEPARIRAASSGYVQRIELARLMRDLLYPGIHLRLLVCPGDFVTEETVIAEVRPRRLVDPGFLQAIHKPLVIERERDILQDARFGVRQLADIALRALSPAVNDPTTGILCIKYLQAVFERLVHHFPQPTIYRFAEGTSTLEIRQPAFEEYLEVCAEIGHYAGGNSRVINALLSMLTHVEEITIQLKMQELQKNLKTMQAMVTAQAIAQGIAQSSLQNNRSVIHS